MGTLGDVPAVGYWAVLIEICCAKSLAPFPPVDRNADSVPWCPYYCLQHEREAAAGAHQADQEHPQHEELCQGESAQNSSSGLT